MISKKLKRVIWCILTLLFVSVGCVTTSAPLLPSSFNIDPPSQDVPAEVNAFLGVWEGSWGRIIDTIIAVEKIDEDTASLMYSWGGEEPGYVYIEGNVLPGPTIEWRIDQLPGEDNVDCPCVMTLKMNKDLNSILGFASLEAYKFKLRADLKRRQ